MLCAALAVGEASLVPGCAMDVIRVQSDQPVMLAEDVPARIFVRDAAGNWTKSANRVLLQAGSYVITHAAATSRPVR